MIRCEQRRKKQALVYAARQARGSIFMFTDSDCIVAADAISICVGVFRGDPNIGAVSGHARALNRQASWLTRLQDVWYDGQFAVNRAAESSFSSVTCVSGPLAAFRREAIVNYLPAWADDEFLGQPFLFATDRQLTAYVLGQRHIGARLKARHADDPLVLERDYPPRDWKIQYVKSARVWTNVPTTTRKFLRQQVRWKKSFIRNVAFNGPWMWRRGIGPALLYYGHVLWVAAAVDGLSASGVAAAAWRLSPDCALSRRRCLQGSRLGGCVPHREPTGPGWLYRPFVTLLSCVVLSWLIVWAALTVRKPVWARG